MTIDQTITPHPKIPDKDSQSADEFNKSVDEHFQWMEGFSAEVTEWGGQANELFCEVSIVKDKTLAAGAAAESAEKRAEKVSKLAVAACDSSIYSSDRVYRAGEIVQDPEDNYYFYISQRDNNLGKAPNKNQETDWEKIRFSPAYTNKVFQLALRYYYYGENSILEMFGAPWTRLPFITGRAAGNSGQKILNMTSVEGLKEKEEYVLFDGVNKEIIEIKNIADLKIECNANLNNNYSNAFLKKTSFTISNGKALCKPGDIYLSSEIDMGSEKENNTVVVCFKKTSAEIKLSYKASGSDEYKTAEWFWERDVADEGVIEREYIIPVKGKFRVKIEGKDNDSGVDFFYMGYIPGTTGLNGRHHPPQIPVMVSPLDGAVDVGGDPAFTTSIYSHVCGTGLKASRFQVSSAPNFALDNIVADSGMVPGISWNPGRGILVENTSYYIRSMHMDKEGGESGWSDSVYFTTKAGFTHINTPRGLSPGSGDAVKGPNSVILVGGTFGVTGENDTHFKRRYQVSETTDFKTIVYDSGASEDLMRHDIPDGTLDRGKRYYWRIKDQGKSTKWSEWSAVLNFSIDETSNFVATLGGNSHDCFNGVATDSKGNFYAVGQTYSSGEGDDDALIVKYNSSGELQWQKTLGKSGSEYFNKVTTCSRGYIYAVGHTGSSGEGSWDSLIVKYKPSGSILWGKTLGGGKDEYFRGITTDSSGNIYTVGNTASSIKGYYDALIVKYNFAGEVQWQKILVGSKSDLFYGVASDSKGNAYAVGMTQSLGEGKGDALIVKYNPSGEVQWQKTLGGNEGDYFFGVTIDSNDYIYVAGITQSSGEGSHEGLVVKYTCTGSIEWQKTLGGSKSEYFNGVTTDSSGNIYVVGYTMSSGAGAREGLVVKYNSSGELWWQKTLGGTNNEDFKDVTIDCVDNLCFAGAIESSGEGGADSSIILIDLDATNTSGVVADMTTLSWESSSLTTSTSQLITGNSSLMQNTSTLKSGTPNLTPGVSTLTSQTSLF